MKTTAGDTRSLMVDLAIDAEEFLRFYKGAARTVVVTAVNGQTVRFPANILKPFVAHNGVHGRFEITFSANGKLIAIDKLS